jgi:hypothetical protein
MTLPNYAHHVAAISLYYGKIPTLLDQEQAHKYLFCFQKHSKTPSQTYLKQTVHLLHFLLKSEGLPYESYATMNRKSRENVLFDLPEKNERSKKIRITEFARQ